MLRKLSKMTDFLIGQPMFALMTKANELEKLGRSIMHFEIGDPSFNSPTHAIAAAKKALDNNLTHYTNSMGLQEFRESVCDYVKLNLGFKPELNQVLICPANAIIDFVIRCVADPGEEIIYPNPGFPTYHSSIHYNRMGAVPIALKEENNFRMDPEDVRRKISLKTRLIIINTPQNPTGSVMVEEEISQIAHIAAKHDAYLLSDEVYSKITYGTAHHSPSTLDRCRDRTIILDSLSKIYSMSGWRLGYAIGPEKLIQKMGLLLQTIMSCLPAFTQIGGIAALTGDQEFLIPMLKDLRKRRDVLVQGLNALPGISCVVPDGAFYAFPNIKKTGMNSQEYSEKLLQASGVCVLPGNCFGEFGEGYVRLCYASSTVEIIEEALMRMKEFHENNLHHGRCSPNA